MDLINYLNHHFLTEAQLLEASAIDATALAAFQARGVMPLPAYRLRLEMACDSFFGAHAGQASVDYYARGYPAWIGLLQSGADARAAFTQRYRARLDGAAIRSAHPKLNEDLDAHLAGEWAHFLNGTYGLCTRSGLPEQIAEKELATMVIQQLISSERALTDAETACLSQAVEMLDRASALFAPHERSRSSRHRLVDEVRKRYLGQA
ncbi:MAG: DUF6058 family natural product biosynthesis protein [Pseudomonadota bacterium]